MCDSYHIPVMLHQTIDALCIRPGGLYVDGTLGGGGHSEEILKRGGNLIAFDRDREAIDYVSARFESKPEYAGRYTLIHDNFKNHQTVLSTLSIKHIDGAVLDLGFSSRQIDVAERGFSYTNGAAVDMRMDQSQFLSAKTVLNEYAESELVRILYAYGEERLAPVIAKAIVRERAKKPIETTQELSKIVIACYPPYYNGGHPAKRVFQALRIEVNQELDGLDEAVKGLVSLLKPGGRLSVITFHSLEDRIVKLALRHLATDCVCPKSLPVCVCGKSAEVKLIGKGQRPDDEETGRNPRAKSATLRVAEKI